MNKIDSENCIILSIDIQEKLVNMLDNGSLLVNEAQKIIRAADILNVPVIITEQYPKGLGPTVDEIKSSIKFAMNFEKKSFSALDEVKIYDYLYGKNKKQIIIFGIETHICVLQSALDLLKQDYEVFVVKNASASRHNDDNETALRRLIHMGASVVTTEMVLFELLKSSSHPKFREVQSLIK